MSRNNRSWNLRRGLQNTRHCRKSCCSLRLCTERCRAVSCRTRSISKRQYPQIEVKEPAFLPERPVYPDYLRDSGISVAASVLAGVAGTGLYDFLNRPGRQSGLPQLQPVFVNAPGAPVLEQAGVSSCQVRRVTAALAHQMNREFSVSEVLTLFRGG